MGLVYCRPRCHQSIGQRNGRTNEKAHGQPSDLGSCVKDLELSRRVQL